MDSFVSRLVFVFGMSVFLAGFYSANVYYGARGDLLRGPLSAGAISVVKGILVIVYVREPIMVVVAALGQVLGFFLALKFIERRGAGDGVCP